MLRRILIVEDNALNRRVLCNILHREYEVLEAENGEEALAVLHRKHKVISAVVLDIAMPVLDGFEVLKKMRSNAALSQIPVIIATGAQDEDTETKALALGANDFVAKPYNPALILHCLRNTINLRETASIINAIQRDKLTGLYNREAFFDKAEAFLREHAPGYYVMASFDIDNFKVVNDQYGAAEGDRILQHIGKVAKKCFAEIGGISSRISADNFAALYPAGEKEIAHVIKLRETEFVPRDTHAPIVFSVGRYVVTDLTLSASAIYDRAYLAKQSIKGRYDEHTAYFSESMRDKLLEEQAIISDMDAALELRQFEPWFQPQFNHATGALIGAEALVRWRHPVRGLIPPDKFVPVFEQNGFIYELDKYMWEQVCAFLNKWMQEGRAPLAVSVNISRYDIFREDLFDILTGLIERYGIPVDLLRLEITESAFAKSAERIIAIVRRLIDYGFTVEIDDFGSGYSSLNTLKDVPAAVLKLDMRFLESTGDSQRGGNIIESIVRMAKWLGMSVIAEGVETIEQADYLKTIGCNYIQGYLYARPMPAEAYEALAAKAEKEERLLALETVENLDNNAFWDPASMDTLIFNSYVGGACIFEYHTGSVEMLRANDRYAEVIGSAGMTVEDALKLNWREHLDEESRASLRQVIRQSTETGGSVTGEYVFWNLPGCPEKTYLLTTIRVIAKSGDHYLIYCTNENVTALRQAERKEHETTAQMQAIMANINGGVTASVLREGGPQILFANEQFYRQRGYTKEQYEREVPRSTERIQQEDRARFEKLAAEASRAGKPFSITYRVIRRDGAIRWLQSNISITALAGVDEPVQIAVSNDITELLETEARERRVSEQLQAIMDDAGSGITASVFTEDGVQFLLANDQYFEILGFAREQYEREVKNIFDLVHPDDRERIARIAGEAYRAEQPAQLEYRVIRRDGEERWVRAILSATRFTGVEQSVQLCIFSDVTAQKDAERALRETDEQLRFLNETAHDLLAQPDSEKALQGVLKKLLGYFGGHRAYIFEFNYADKTADNTYEVCAPGVTPEREHLQNVPLTLMDFWLHVFDQNSYVSITDVDALDESRAEERQVLQAQSIRSLVAVPLWRDGERIGFIGIDDPEREHAHVDRLVALGDYIAVLLTRRDLEEKIRSDNKALQEFMNDMPGGFVRMRMYPDGTIVPIYFNEGFYQLVGMDHDALKRLYGEDALAGVHPDDVDIVRETVARMLEKGEACSEKYRLQHGGGAYIWVMIFGRATKGACGEVYFNIYYTDATEQNKTDEQRLALLDNLPCGAGVCEISGDKVRMTYLNKRYRDYLHRAVGGGSEASVFDVVHPDDREKLREAMQPAFEQGGEGSCDIRIADGTGGYLPFRLVGSALKYSGNKNAVYVTFTPISKEELSYSQMLPVALSAVIADSPDLTFVKDRNYRYVCCSPSFALAGGMKRAEDVVGKTDYDLVDKEYADRYRAEEELLVKTGQARLDYDEIMPTRDGSLRYASTSKYPLLDANGSVIGIYGVTRDMTQAHEADSRLKLLTDSIPGGIATYACTRGRMSVTSFNDAYCALFGMTKAEYERQAAADPMGAVFDEDRSELDAQLRALIERNQPIDWIYRVHVKGGGYRWVNSKAVATERHGETVMINAVLFDVTQQQEATERLRISEEEHRLATQHSGNVVCRFNVANRTATLSPEAAARFAIPEKAEDVPYGPVRKGEISPESAAAYTAFYEGILHGEKTGAAVFQQMTKGGWRWLSAQFSTIFSAAGAPVSAVVSFNDVTEQLEKEAVYKKWQQSLAEKDAASYTLFRCNLSKNASFDTVEGSLLPVVFEENAASFNERTDEYVDQWVYEEDRERYRAVLNSDTLLANYYRGKRAEALEYREKRESGGARWLRLTIDLVEYPNSKDVEAYLMYENIDDSKRAELLTIERAETDALTGVLNRATFAARVEQLAPKRMPGMQHALLMLDVDGFKLVNDVFGHGAGDETLIGIAASMRTVLRPGDLLGRLGGDEFVVFLSNIPNDAVAANKAKRICALVRKSFSVEVQISASVGIVICPQDGENFDTLYKKADAALYYVKGSGKDGFAFYRDDMDDEHLAPQQAQPTSISNAIGGGLKRRMLIVDDNRIDHAFLTNLFAEEFIVEKARDGNSALVRLRHYGSAISIVLLDLMMPGMDGFTVLERMQASAEMRAIPVIVVSGTEDRETSLRAIRSGATDYITKPVDADLLRIRVHSAISRAENERLRAQNSFLKLQSAEIAKYRTVFEHTGTVLIEHDWVNGSFTYDASISAYLAGRWDQRRMWQILLSDLVADVPTVKRMQELVHDVANDRARSDGALTAQLRKPSKEKGLFRMNVYKQVNEYQLADKLVITLREVAGPPGLDAGA